MIGLLRGRVIQRQPPFLLLEVNGVGYEVEAPMSTFYDLPAGDEPVTLYTHLMVRDDAHTLFGFVRERDRALFRMLLKVSGVGGKMALAILSGMTADEFSLAVAPTPTRWMPWWPWATSRPRRAAWCGRCSSPASAPRP